MSFKTLLNIASLSFLTILLTFSIGTSSIAYAATPNPTPSSGDAPQTADQYCTIYSDPGLKAACKQGFGNISKKESDACNAYSGDKLNACTDGWGSAKKVDPALTCVKDQCDLVAKYVNPTINVLSVSFGLIAVISIILGAVQYSASEGDPQRAGAAKNRITNTIIAIVAYLLLYSFLEFLVPGGVFNRSLGG
jgi:Type IV secretion system pilin